MPVKPSVFDKELAYRLGERVGRGMNLRQAATLEGDTRISQATVQRALDKDKVFRGVYDAAVAQFVDAATTRLAKSADGTKFILERRHSREWGRQPDVIQQSVTVNGMPAGLLERIRQITRAKLCGPPAQKQLATVEVPTLVLDTTAGGERPEPGTPKVKSHPTNVI